MVARTRDRMINRFQKWFANPLMRRVPTMTLLETTGRNSGQPRRTPVGERLVGGQFWMVSEFGERSQYVRNIKVDPRVRIRARGRWRCGTASLLPDDDARARLRSLPRVNSAAVDAIGSGIAHHSDRPGHVVLVVSRLPRPPASTGRDHDSRTVSDSAPRDRHLRQNLRHLGESIIDRRGGTRTYPEGNRRSTRLIGRITGITPRCDQFGPR